jgi:hypothetical protein
VAVTKGKAASRSGPKKLSREQRNIYFLYFS